MNNQLPFTSDQFFDAMAAYNVSVFPMQIVLMLMAAALVVMSLVKSRHSGIVGFIVLGAMWMWMGTVYHWLFFAPVNPTAYVFGGAFVLQSILLFYVAFAKGQAFEFRNNLRGITGLTLTVFALGVYPVIGFSLGHVYPSQPTFGLPCPTTIFTFGMLLMATKRMPWCVFVVPVLWSMLGFSASWLFGVHEDIALPLSALLTVVLLIAKPVNSDKIPVVSVAHY